MIWPFNKRDQGSEEDPAGAQQPGEEAFQSQVDQALRDFGQHVDRKRLSLILGADHDRHEGLEVAAREHVLRSATRIAAALLEDERYAPFFRDQSPAAAEACHAAAEVFVSALRAHGFMGEAVPAAEAGGAAPVVGRLAERYLSLLEGEQLAAFDELCRLASSGAAARPAGSQNAPDFPREVMRAVLKLVLEDAPLTATL